MDTVANISDWIKPHITLQAGVTKWYQFRVFAHEGQVRLQCRSNTSQGAPWGAVCDDEKRDAIFTVMWKDPKNPPQITGDALVPPSQAREQTGKVITKMRAAIDHLAPMYNLPPTTAQELHFMIDELESTVPVAFAWSSETCRRLYGAGRADVEVQEAPDVQQDLSHCQEVVAGRIRMEANGHYLWKNADYVEGSRVEHEALQYCIGLAVMRDVKGDEGGRS